MVNITIIANSTCKSGKSTTFLNLGICMATMSQRTLLLDLNTDGWVSHLCNPAKKNSMISLNIFLSYKQGTRIDFDEFHGFDQVLIDCPIHLNKEVFGKFSDLAKVVVPVEAEFYGLNSLPQTLRELDTATIHLLGFLPVLVKPESVPSQEILRQLRAYFGSKVFEPTIQRNFYLARQKDYNRFILSELTEKAAVTYLPLANLLL